MTHQEKFNQLLEAGVHFGHLKRKWNPKMAPYIFGDKKGIHIIDLNKTIAKLDETAAAMKQIAKSGKKIMFVATKKQAKEILSIRARLNEILAKNTGQTIKKIESDTERDNFMTSDEALKYGIIDNILDSRPED